MLVMSLPRVSRSLSLGCFNSSPLGTTTFLNLLTSLTMLTFVAGASLATFDSGFLGRISLFLRLVMPLMPRRLFSLAVGILPDLG